MKTTIVGIAAVLALTTTTASARDIKGIEKVAAKTSASPDTARKSKDVTKTVATSSNVTVAQAGAGNVKKNPVDVSASHAERWLVEREGYRDGGY